MQEENKSPEGNLRDIYYVIFRHRKKLVIFFVAVVVAVTLWSVLMEDFYRSEAKLLLKIGRENVVLDPTVTNGQYVTGRQPRNWEINTELEILRSREIAEKIVDAIGAGVILYGLDEVIVGETSTIYQTSDDMKMTIKEIRSALGTSVGPLERMKLENQLLEHNKSTLAVMDNLEIIAKSSNNIVSLACAARNPQLANEVLTKLIDFYLEIRYEAYQTSGSYDFFVEQSNLWQNRLIETEEKLRQLKNETGISSLDDQRFIFQEQISKLMGDKETINSDIVVSNSRIQQLQEILDNTRQMIEMGNVTGIDNVILDRMKQTLYDLQLQEQELLTKYTEESQIVKNKRRQIAAAAANLNAVDSTQTQQTQGTLSVNETFQKLETDLFNEKINFTSLEKKSEMVTKHLEDAKNALVNLNNIENRILKLEREKLIQENNYNRYQNNLEEIRINRELEEEKISNVSIIQPPSLPVKKSGPNRKMNVFIGSFFAFFSSIGLAFVLEYVDNTIKSPEDVKGKLNLDTLVSIAKYPKKTLSQ